MFVLKSTFKKLQEELNRTEKNLCTVYDRLWILEHPYKFNIGDKVKFTKDRTCQTGIVVEREMGWSSMGFLSERYKRYEILIGSEKISLNETALTKHK